MKRKATYDIEKKRPNAYKGVSVGKSKKKKSTWQAMAPELKFHDLGLNFLFDSLGEVPATGQLNLIAQGDTESTRDGRQCNLESIQMRLLARFDPGVGTPATGAGTCHMYVVLDKQANGAAAAITDVVQTTNLATALINLNNSRRFRIIKKFKFTFEPKSGVSGAFNTQVLHKEWYKKLNIPLDFQGTTGAITELRSNNLFLIAGSDGFTDDTVNLTGAMRLRFRG